MDDAGGTGTQRLTDGDEVEILAWRPRGAGGPRYRVQSRKHGLEGWISAEHLRTLARQAPAAPAAAGAPSPKVAGDEPPKFGQRAR